MTRPGGTWQNWGRSASVRPQRVERPASAEAVQRAVQAAGRVGMPVKAVGAGHSVTGIAVAPGALLDLTDLSGVISVDEARSRVRLRAGTRLHQIPGLLRPYGLAMPNLGDIDRQSISGAISTGTHGTGTRFGGIATQVVGVTLVTADGEALTVDETENSEFLPAVALGLGALGVIVDVTLQCVPAFGLRDFMNRVFHALQDTRTPFRVSCLVVATNIALNLVLRLFLGARGLALATSIAGYTGLVTLLALLKRRFGRLGLGRIVPELLKIAAGALLCAGTCAAMNRLLPPVFGTGRVFLRLAACTAASMTVYAVTCWATGVKTFREFVRGAARRVR